MHSNTHTLLTHSPVPLLLYQYTAMDLSTISPSSCHETTLLVLDGTWAQARSIHTQNPFLHSLKQVTYVTPKTAHGVMAILEQPTFSNSCIISVVEVEKVKEEVVTPIPSLPSSPPWPGRGREGGMERGMEIEGLEGYILHAHWV